MKIMESDIATATEEIFKKDILKEIDQDQITKLIDSNNGVKSNNVIESVNGKTDSPLGTDCMLFIKDEVLEKSLKSDTNKDCENGKVLIKNEEVMLEDEFFDENNDDQNQKNNDNQLPEDALVNIPETDMKDEPPLLENEEETSDKIVETETSEVLPEISLSKEDDKDSPPVPTLVDDTSSILPEIPSDKDEAIDDSPSKLVVDESEINETETTPTSIEESNSESQEKINDAPQDQPALTNNDDDDDDCIELIEDDPRTDDQAKASELEKQNADDSTVVVDSDKQDVSKDTSTTPPMEKTFILKPLSFMNLFKEQLKEMSRDDLEEFCLVKFSEAIDSKSNLSKAQSETQALSNNLDEWRKKVVALQKQNKDLQIVVKTISDEIKKRNDDIPVPIKITRSVGLQVGMPCLVKKHDKGPTGPAKRGPKPRQINPPTPSPIAKKPATPSPNTPNTPTNVTTPSKDTANKPSPLQAPSKLYTQLAKTPTTTEKRPSQQTIDLTDDEPPAKQMKMPVSRVTNPPVRNIPVQGQKQYAHMNAKSPSLKHVGPKQVFIPITNQQQNRLTIQQQVKPVQRYAVPALRPAHNKYLGPLHSIAQARPMLPTPSHPAPLPALNALQVHQSHWKLIPPKPTLKIMRSDNGIVISWEMTEFRVSLHEEVASYQIFAYQQTQVPPSTDLWKKIGDVKALPLPMACTLTHFLSGFKYFFAIRALDVKSRVGPFSIPQDIVLV